MSVEYEALVGYVDDRLVTRGLIDWAIRTDRRIQIPARSWRRAGHTAARLVRLYVVDRDHSTQLIVLKVLPPGPIGEAAAHYRAVREAPEAFRVHLAGQVFDPVPLPDGRVLTFQTPADLGDGTTPLAEVPVTELPGILETMTVALIREWNPDVSVTESGVTAAVRAEFSIHPSALRGVTPRCMAGPHWFGLDGVVVPNPAHLVGESSVLDPERLDLAIGRVHRDLHDGNVLVSQRAGGHPSVDFSLVDLTSYARYGQLGQDPVRLLLCAIGRLLEKDLSESQSRLVLTALTRPTTRPSPLLPPLATDLRDAVYQSAAALLRGCGTWPNQYLLSLTTQGMVMSTFEDLGPRRRWWYFQLAAHAARELLVRLGRGREVPIDGPDMANPFGRRCGSHRSDPARRREANMAPDLSPNT